MAVKCGPECVIACDFCIYFRAESLLTRGIYDGDGRCVLKEVDTEPGNGCDDFHCFRAGVLTREICKRCGRESPVGFDVPDEIWEKAVPPQYRDRVLCIHCFDELATRAGVDWTDAIKFWPASGMRALKDGLVAYGLVLNREGHVVPIRTIDNSIFRSLVDEEVQEVKLSGEVLQEALRYARDHNIFRDEARMALVVDVLAKIQGAIDQGFQLEDVTLRLKRFVRRGLLLNDAEHKES